MPDERIAVLRHLDVEATPDPAFVAALHDVLRERARDARRRDASRLGRLAATWADRSASNVWTPAIRLVIVAGLLVAAAMVLALMAGGRPSPQPLLFLTPTGLEEATPERDTVRDIASLYGAGLSVSPDGAFAAVLTAPDPSYDTAPTSTSGVTAFDLRTGASRRWSLPGGDVVVSSEGRVAWTAEERTADGTPEHAPAIYVASLGDVEPVVWSIPGGRSPGAMSWSPDGRRLAVGTSDDCPGTGAALLLFDTAGAAREVLDDLASGDISWSPDGTRLLVQRLVGGSCSADGLAEAVTIDATTGSVRPLGFGGDMSTVWTDGGGHLVGAVPAPTGTSIVEVRPDGSERHAIAELPRAVDLGAGSPVGRRVLATSAPATAPSGDSTYTVSLMVVEPTGSLTMIADDVWYAYPRPAWSADGRWIAFARAPTDPGATHGEIRAGLTLWVVHPDGTGLKQISEQNVAPGTLLGWSP